MVPNSIVMSSISLIGMPRVFNFLTHSLFGIVCWWIWMSSDDITKSYPLLVIWNPLKALGNRATRSSLHCFFILKIFGLWSRPLILLHQKDHYDVQLFRFSVLFLRSLLEVSLTELIVRWVSEFLFSILFLLSINFRVAYSAKYFVGEFLVVGVFFFFFFFFQLCCWVLLNLHSLVQYQSWKSFVCY